jgi:peptidoglycan-N-acetylglucosamine deacetylase
MKRLMMLILFLLGTVTFQAFGGVNEIWQYPEERIYTEADRGLSPYRASSLYQTGTFGLTFDDGPDPELTPLLLDTLKKHNTKATFFILTDKINEKTLPIVYRILEEGHILATHGPDHSRSTEQSELIWKGGLMRSLQDLSEVYKMAGQRFDKIFYRFPYGAYGSFKSRFPYHHMNSLLALSKELMGENCIQFAFWDVDTADWVPGMTPQEISQNIISHYEGGEVVDFEAVKVNGRTVYRKKPFVLRNPPGGGIILQHDIHRNSVLAVDLFLKRAKDLGIQILPLDEIEEFRVLRNCSL